MGDSETDGVIMESGSMKRSNGDLTPCLLIVVDDDFLVPAF